MRRALELPLDLRETAGVSSAVDLWEDCTMADDAATRPPGDAQPRPSERLAEDLLNGISVPSPTIPLSAGPESLRAPQDAVPTQRLAAHGAPPPIPVTPAIGRALPSDAPDRIGPYILLSSLGRGGMGAVYLAEEQPLARKVALKVMLSEAADDAELVERFYREAKACAALSHPNVVTLHAYGQAEGIHYCALEFVEGRPASELMRKERVPQERAAALVRQAADGLAHAHRNGVVHRDVKPSNLLVTWRRVEHPQELSTRERAAVVAADDAHTDTGRRRMRFSTGDGAPGPSPTVVDLYEDHVKVADFGLARVADARTLVRSQVGLGTPPYMAPEQFAAARDAGPAADVYSLGATLYEMLTGRPPFGGDDWRVIQRQAERDDPVPPRKLTPTVDRDLEAVTLKCLEKSPRRRYADAGALADDLSRWLRCEPVQARPVGLVGRFVRRVRRRPLVSGLVGCVLALVLATAWKTLAPARVTLTTDPAGAEVEAIGTTLWKGSWVWPPRSFRLRVRAKGYLPSREISVPVAPGETTSLGTIALEVEPGTLHLDGCPAGVSVRIIEKRNERERTVVSAPAEVNLPPGEYTLAASLRGSFPREYRIQITPGETTNINVSLAEQLLWKTKHWDGALSPFSVADMDGDGVLDCVVGSEDGKVYAVSGRDGSILWSTEARGGAPPSQSSSDEEARVCAAAALMSVWRGSSAFPSRDMADLNRDGILDSVVGFSDGGAVCAVSGRNGAILWRHITGGPVGSTPALADLNGDGVLDALVGSGDRSVYALSGKDGSVLWSRETRGPVFSSPTVADLNSDGVIDCVVGSDDGWVYALSGKDGGIIWTAETKGSVSCTPALGDLDADGTPDCVVGSCDHFVYAMSGRDGHLLWRFQTGWEVLSSPALADLDRDHSLDCVVGSEDSHFYALRGRDGTLLWRRETGGSGASSPALAELDGDGVDDCIVGSSDHHLWAISGASGATIWQYETVQTVHSPVLADLYGDGLLYCLFGSDDRSLYAVSARDSISLWTYETGGLAFACSNLADLNEDGDPDCLVVSTDQKVYALSGRDGSCLWTFRRDGKGLISAELADLNGDSVADCVVNSGDHQLFALSGKSGTVLWKFDAPGLMASASLKDLNGDGVPDCIVGCADGEVFALSGRDGSTLWKAKGSESITSCSPLADLTCDGVPDVVVGTRDKLTYALSGKDGSVLWKSDLNLAAAGRSINEADSFDFADLNHDGVLDCVAVDVSGFICALSGRDGSVLLARMTSHPLGVPSFADLDGDGELDAVTSDLDDGGDPCMQAESWTSGATLWSYEVDDWLTFKSRLVDVNGDGSPDIIAGGQDGGLYVFSVRDGALLWSYRRAGDFPSSATTADLNRDGLEDLIVVWGNHVQALSGRRVSSVASKLGERRQHGNWKTLRDEATQCLKNTRDAWAKAVCWTHLGLARLHLGDAEGARGALEQGRSLGLRSPDAAVFEWLASWRWKACPADLRTESRRVLIEAIVSKPHNVFDAFCEIRDLLTEEASNDLSSFEEGMTSEDARIACTMLLAVLKSRKDFPQDGLAGTPPELFSMIEKVLLSRIRNADRNLARWYGYLALLADLQGDHERFDRACEIYESLPARRPSLDRLLPDIAQKEQALSDTAGQGRTPEWLDAGVKGTQAVQRGEFAFARPLLEQVLADAAKDPYSTLGEAQQLFQICRLDLARIYSQASIGKDSRSDPGHAVEPLEAKRLRERAFKYLEEAIGAGGVVAEGIVQGLSEDPDWAPLREEPRWGEMLKGTRK